MVVTQVTKELNLSTRELNVLVPENETVLIPKISKTRGSEVTPNKEGWGWQAGQVTRKDVRSLLDK